MQKFFTVIATILCVIVVNARDPYEKDVIVNQTLGGGRYESPVPEIYYSTNDGEMNIAFDANDIFVLEVRDEIGSLVYSTIITTDGNFYSYDMQLQPETTYFITIMSTEGCFEGILEI